MDLFCDTFCSGVDITKLKKIRAHLWQFIMSYDTLLVLYVNLSYDNITSNVNIVGFQIKDTLWQYVKWSYDTLPSGVDITKIWEHTYNSMFFWGENFANWRPKRRVVNCTWRIFSKKIPQIHHILRRKKVEIVAFKP